VKVSGVQFQKKVVEYLQIALLNLTTNKKLYQKTKNNALSGALFFVDTKYFVGI